MSSLLNLDPSAYFPTSSNLVGIWDGLSVGVRRSYPTSRLLSWPQIRIFQVSPQGDSSVRSSRVTNLVITCPLWYLKMSPGASCPMEPSLVGAEGSDRASESGYEVGSLIGFFIGGMGSEVGSAEGGSLRDSRGFYSY